MRGTRKRSIISPRELKCKTDRSRSVVATIYLRSSCRPLLERAAALHLAARNRCLIYEPDAHAYTEKKNLVTVPLDELPERCTLTILPEISARRSLSA